MKKTAVVLCIMLMLSTSAVFTGCVTQQPKPTPETLEQLAIGIVTQLEEHNYTGVYSHFNTSITSQLTAAQFQTVWQQQVVNTYGNITGIVSNRTANESGYPVVYVTCTFSIVPEMDVKIVFNEQNLIISLTVVPTPVAYTPPSYVNLSAFTEESVTVGLGGEFPLPGNLTVPKGEGPFPAVVLVQGSGPSDQDETVGPNKPFKDIAWGLASHGIVVLRYVKRTKEYPQKSIDVQNFTVEDETIDDVITAVSLLYNTSMVNHSQIFVLGHSLGGYLAPRIALQDPLVDGLIIMAGPTRPLEDLILEQTKYLANLSGVNESAQIAAIKAAVVKIQTLNFTNNETILGAPGSYWRDLAHYNPVATAEELHIPMLILQGLRDYQVTLQDFDAWEQAFSGNPNVTLKTYPSLNHLFISGTGVPTNTEYLIPGHVAVEVINNIATWIKSH